MESSNFWSVSGAMKERISKKRFSHLIQENAIENVIQGLFKEDMSLLSEVYAYPQAEYICFSEFSIGDGFADFVVFTGRSRMEVIVIEIKGADFSFSNSSSYRNMSFKINEAAQQVRRKLNFINANYNEFRAFVHKVREQVELGRNIYNSLLGPNGYLHVDPNKDICVSGVLIGGNCKDDLYESKLRHEFETTSSSKIRVESWDSWMRKLTRE